jgi:dCMP deaminase
MDKYKGLYQEVQVPSWDEYFYKIAVDVSSRSPDYNTKHGCVLVDMNNHIIGTGYNAPARKIDITKIPNTRPGKYLYFVHSEINSLLNTTIPVWSIQGGIKAYITGTPCIQCLSALINAGTKEIIYNPNRGWTLTEEHKEDFDFLIEQSGIKLRGITI